MSEKTNRPPLKWLLIPSFGIILVGLVPMVWYASLPDDFHVGRKLQARGFAVIYDTFWRHPIRVEGEHLNITPEDGWLISQLPHLHGMYFINCDMPDLNLDEIGNCQNLDVAFFLGVRGLPIDELRKLAPCPVTYLVLCNADLKDSDLEILMELPKLGALSLLGNTGITDTGLEHLENISSLRHLNLQSTSVTQEGVEVFKKKRSDVKVSL